jgi:hypothetical protein
MLKKTEAEATLENCRALIDKINAGLSAEEALVSLSSAAELLLHLESAASVLKRSCSREQGTKVAMSIISGPDGPTPVTLHRRDL